METPEISIVNEICHPGLLWAAYWDVFYLASARDGLRGDASRRSTARLSLKITYCLRRILI